MGEASACLPADLGVSQPTISRLMAALRAQGDVVVLGGGSRDRRYAAVDPRSHFRGGVPLYRVREGGRVEPLGRLVALAEDQTAVVRGRSATHYPGVPWFIEELRPDGFLGRLFARRIAPDLGVDHDPRRWSRDDLLRALHR